MSYENLACLHLFLSLIEIGPQKPQNGTEYWSVLIDLIEAIIYHSAADMHTTESKWSSWESLSHL